MFGLIYTMNKKITKFKEIDKKQSSPSFGAAVLVYAVYSYMQKDCSC